MRRMLAFAGACVLGGAITALPAAARQTGDVEAFCTAAVDTEALLTQIEDEPSEAQIEKLQRLFTQVETTAPPEVSAQVTTLTTAFREATQTGQDPFEQPGVPEAETALSDYMLANCGYETVEVAGFEYDFDGVPKTLEAGTYGFEFTNTGAELHEMVVFRIKTDDKLKELLDLPEKKALKRIQNVGFGFAPPEGRDVSFLKLTKPGRYGVVCFIPVGTTSETEEGDGPPHFAEGMAFEFRVKK